MLTDEPALKEEYQQTVSVKAYEFHICKSCLSAGNKTFVPAADLRCAVDVAQVKKKKKKKNHMKDKTVTQFQMIFFCRYTC